MLLSLCPLLLNIFDLQLNEAKSIIDLITAVSILVYVLHI